METNFKNLINDIKNEIGEYDLTETPIPFSEVDNYDTEVFLTEQVTEEYLKLIKLINQKETAKEYTFALLGKRGTLNGTEIILFEELVYTFDKDKELKKTECQHDKDILTEAVFRKGYGVVSIGHTHPVITDKEAENKIVNKLSKETKEKYGIKKPGLNLSGADLSSLKKVIPQVKDKEIFQTIILPGGEMFIIGLKDNKYFKYQNILALSNEQDVDITSLNAKFCEKKYIK